MIRNRFLSATSLGISAFIGLACGDGDPSQFSSGSGGEGGGGPVAVGGTSSGGSASGGAATGGRGGAVGSSCPTNLLECNDECVNLDIDYRNCGACGTACEANEACIGGTCEPSACPTGQAECSDECVNLVIDYRNCGTCGTACEANEACVAGFCEPSACPTGQVECSDECVNAQIDYRNCGSCGNACGGAEACVAGFCEPSDCPTGQVRCGDECVTLSSSREHCGACDAACGEGELCVSGDCNLACGEGLVACAESCIDPSNDPEYCGATSCEAEGDPGEVRGELEACVIGECREFIRVWSTGARVDTRSTNVGQEQAIAMDTSGNALLFWRQLADAADTTTNTLRPYASFYDASTKKWSSQVQLDTDPIRVRNLKVAMSPNGDGIAVWIAGPSATESVSTTPSQVRAAHFTGATRTWGSVVRLDVVTGPADTPDVAMNGEGEALVAWSQRDGAGIRKIYADRLVEGVFVGAEPLASQGDGSSQFPQVAINDAGNMAIAWEERVGPAAVWAPHVSRFAGAWMAPQDLRTPSGKLNSEWGRAPDLALDAAGNISVVFTEEVFAVDVSVYTSVFDEAAQTWSATALAEDVAAPAVNPRLAVDRDGVASLVFQVGQLITTGAFKGDVTSFAHVYAGRRTAAGVWSPSVQLADLPAVTNERAFPRVMADQQGNAFAFWVRTPQAFTSRFTALTSLWVGPELLGAANATGVGSPDLAVSVGGNALASWVETNGADVHIFASRFD